MRNKTIWHWWERGKRISRYRALIPPGIYNMRILNVREDHKGRVLIDAEMIR